MNQTITFQIPLNLPEPFQEVGSLLNALGLVVKAMLAVCHSLSKLIIDLTSFFLSQFGFGSPPLAISGFLDLILMALLGYFSLGYFKGLVKWLVGILIAVIIVSIAYNAFL